MTIFSKRNLLLGVATIVIALGASAAIWGVPKFVKKSTSVKGQVSSYLLDDRGAVNGLLLASGDQLHFSPQTGEVIASRIKVGDEVSVIGHAGSQSTYGREVKVEQISANGQTIVEVPAGPPHKHGPGDDGGPKDRGDERRPAPPVAAPTVTADQGSAPASRESANTKQSESATSPAPTPEVFKVTSTIRTHLVNGHGDVDGIILSSGEQVRFSPKVGKLVVTAEQSGNTQFSVEGTGVRNDRGTVIRPTTITVGSQTITLSR